MTTQPISSHVPSLTQVRPEGISAETARVSQTASERLRNLATLPQRVVRFFEWFYIDAGLLFKACKSLFHPLRPNEVGREVGSFDTAVAIVAFANLENLRVTHEHLTNALQYLRDTHAPFQAVQNFEERLNDLDLRIHASSLENLVRRFDGLSAEARALFFKVDSAFIRAITAETKTEACARMRHECEKIIFYQEHLMPLRRLIEDIRSHLNPSQ